MSGAIPESNEVLLEPLRRTVARWNESARRTEHVDHVLEQFVGLVESLIERVEVDGDALDAFQQASKVLGGEAGRLSERSSGFTDEWLSHARSLIAQAKVVKPPPQVEGLAPE